MITLPDFKRNVPDLALFYCEEEEGAKDTAEVLAELYQKDAALGLAMRCINSFFSKDPPTFLEAAAVVAVLETAHYGVSDDIWPEMEELGWKVQEDRDRLEKAMADLREARGRKEQDATDDQTPAQ